MPTTTSAVVQVMIRVPYQLRHRAKVHCVVRDTTLTQLVIDAIRERLETVQHANESGRRTARR